MSALYSDCTEKSSGHTCYTRDCQRPLCDTCVMGHFQNYPGPYSGLNTRLSSVGCSDAVSPPPHRTPPIVIRNPREQVSVSAVLEPPSSLSRIAIIRRKKRKAPPDPRGEILHILQIYWYGIRGHRFLFDPLDTGDNCIQFLPDLAPSRNNITHMSGNILRNYKTSFES